MRLRASTTKTRTALWVDLPDPLADAIEATLPPREDRDPDAPLFPGVSADRLRTAIARACKPPASRSSLRTTSDTAASRFSTVKDAPGQRSAGSSDSGSSPSPRTPTRTCLATAARSTSQACSSPTAEAQTCPWRPLACVACRPRCIPRYRKKLFAGALNPGGPIEVSADRRKPHRLRGQSCHSCHVRARRAPTGAPTETRQLRQLPERLRRARQVGCATRRAPNRAGASASFTAVLCHALDQRLVAGRPSRRRACSSSRSSRRTCV